VGDMKVKLHKIKTSAITGDQSISHSSCFAPGNESQVSTKQGVV